MRVLQPSAVLASALSIGLLVGACGSLPADEPSEAIPRRSLDDLLATLPEPSSERSFVFDGDVVYAGGRTLGRYRLTVEAGDWRGERAWLVVEETEQPAADGPPVRERRTAWLSRDLHVLSGEEAQGLRGVPGELILLRACPAEVAAYGDPADSPTVREVLPDGGLRCSAPVGEFGGIDVFLVGRERRLFEIVRRIGARKVERITPHIRR